MKPILFNTEMVRAILEGRKTVTRRAVKIPQQGGMIYSECGKCFWSDMINRIEVNPPYYPGNILYVQETWATAGKDIDPVFFDDPEPYLGQILYRADFSDGFPECRWRPSINMPREAAQIFLRVTGVRVERLQDITEDQAMAEGFEAFPHEPATVGFVDEWNSTIKKADRALYGWDANPWVWVIEFERCEKPEAAT